MSRPSGTACRWPNEQVVVDPNLVPGAAKGLNRMAADVAGSARHKNVHPQSLCFPNPPRPAAARPHHKPPAVKMESIVEPVQFAQGTPDGESTETALGTVDNWCWTPSRHYGGGPPNLVKFRTSYASSLSLPPGSFVRAVLHGGQPYANDLPEMGGASQPPPVGRLLVYAMAPKQKKRVQPRRCRGGGPCQAAARGVRPLPAERMPSGREHGPRLRRDLRRFFAWLGGRRLEGLTIRELGGYPAWLVEQGLASTSIGRHVVSLRSVLSVPATRRRTQREPGRTSRLAKTVAARAQRPFDTRCRSATRRTGAGRRRIGGAIGRFWN